MELEDYFPLIISSQEPKSTETPTTTRTTSAFTDKESLISANSPSLIFDSPAPITFTNIFSNVDQNILLPTSSSLTSLDSTEEDWDKLSSDEETEEKENSFGTLAALPVRAIINNTHEGDISSLDYGQYKDIEEDDEICSILGGLSIVDSQESSVSTLRPESRWSNPLPNHEAQNRPASTLPSIFFNPVGSLRNDTDSEFSVRNFTHHRYDIQQEQSEIDQMAGLDAHIIRSHSF